VEKMRKEIDEHEGINGLVEEILLGKTIDFLRRMLASKQRQPSKRNGKN